MMTRMLIGQEDGMLWCVLDNTIILTVRSVRKHPSPPAGRTHFQFWIELGPAVNFISGLNGVRGCLKGTFQFIWINLN